jgi:hypothetical protein
MRGVVRRNGSCRVTWGTCKTIIIDAHLGSLLKGITEETIKNTLSDNGDSNYNHRKTHFALVISVQPIYQKLQRPNRYNMLFFDADTIRNMYKKFDLV